MPGLGRPAAPPPVPLHYRLIGDLAGELPFDLVVFDVGLACCAVEFVAATMSDPRFEAVPAGRETSGRAVMVVSGTLTDTMAPFVLECHAALAPPVSVISFGSCANSGGPYWDSYCVTKGVDQLIPVDVYVPGCPPRPESVLHALRVLAHRLDAAS